MGRPHDFLKRFISLSSVLPYASLHFINILLIFLYFYMFLHAPVSVKMGYSNCVGVSVRLVRPRATVRSDD